MKVKFKLLLSSTVEPRVAVGDAGADLYAPNSAILPATGRMKMAMGLAVEIPDGYMGLLLPRSSCAQEGWSVESPPIDSSYRGEIHAMLHNRGQKTWRINTGDRIVQLVIVPCLQIVPEFVSELSSTERGANGFGSTGKGLRIAGNSG